MPTQWQDRYTDLSNINNGNEFEDGDDVLAEHLNAALENVAYLKKIVDLGTKNALTSIECAFDFSYWASYSDGYSPTSDYMGYLSLLATTFTRSPVNILPAGSNTSIAEAYIERISGDDGYVQYDLRPILTNQNYIQFDAKNISNDYIYGLARTGSYTTKTTTFRLHVIDVYGNHFTKSFSISYKVRA